MPLLYYIKDIILAIGLIINDAFKCSVKIKQLF